MHYLIIVAVALAFGCGPSSAQLKTAKTAKYKAEPTEIFRLAVAATAETYKVAEADETKLRLQTVPQFYSSEGQRQSAGAEGFTQIGAGSVRLELVVEVVDMGEGKVAVAITPTTFQTIDGSPKPRELKPDDPNLPPWILGRVDTLALAIYERAKTFASAP
jgi:hypothetical protein